MKLIFSLLAILSSANGQTSQPQCQNYTNVVYAANPLIEPAEALYIDSVAATLATNCIDQSDGSLKPCSITFGQSNVGDNYTRECHEG